MKRVIVKVGTWIRSRFSKRATLVLDQPVEVKESVEILTDPESTDEMAEWKTPIWENPIESEPKRQVYTKHLKYEVIVDGKSFWLSKKQRQMYWAMCQAQKEHSTSSGLVPGKWVVGYYLKSKYTPSELLELEKWQWKPSTHYKTFKQLVKVGIVIRIGQEYQALV